MADPDVSTIEFHVVGTEMLLQHNERLANPMDEHAQGISKIAKKRNKTVADHEELAKLEFAGGLYFDEKIGPYVPGTWIAKGLEQSGKVEKLGTALRQACRCLESKIPIQYKGPRSVEGMWKAKLYDQRMVGVQKRKTLRTRPCFKEGWQLKFTVVYDRTIVEDSQIQRAVERLGERFGIGDYRPLYGRFQIAGNKDDAND